MRRFTKRLAGITPELYGPALWFDLDHGVTLAAGKVAQLDTYRGPAFSVAQAVAGQRPVYNATDVHFNGHASMTLSNAANTFLDNAVDNPIAQSSARTIMAAVRANGGGGGQFGGTIIDFNRSNLDFAFQWFDIFALRFIFGNAAINALIDAPPVIANTAYYLTYVDPGTGALPIFRANGVGYAITAGQTMPAQAAPDGFTIGSRIPNGGQVFDGEITSIAAFPRALPVNEYMTLERGYFKTKYNL